MRLDHKQVPSFPKITATVFHEETAEVTINGVSTTVSGRDLSETRTNIIRLIARTAEKLGRPVRAQTLDDQDEWSLVVYPDGLVESDTTIDTGKRQGKKKSVGQGRRVSQVRVKEARSGTDRTDEQTLPTGQDGAPHKIGDPAVPYSPSTQPVPELPNVPRADTGPEPSGDSGSVSSASPAQAAAADAPSIVDPERNQVTRATPPAVMEPTPVRVPELPPGVERPLVPSPPIPPIFPEAQADEELRPVPDQGHGMSEAGRNQGDQDQRERSKKDDRPRVSVSSLLFRAVRRHRLEERERQTGEDREATPVAPEGPPPAQGSSAVPTPLSKSESGNLWASVIQEINQEREVVRPAPHPAVGSIAGYTTAAGPTPTAGQAPTPAPVPEVLSRPRPGPFTPPPTPDPVPTPDVWAGPTPLPMTGNPSVTQGHGMGAEGAGASTPVPPVSMAPLPTVGSPMRIAVLSLKGGVGKTTTTVLLGSVFAFAGENRAIAVDMNPHSGTLRDRVPLQNPHTLRDFYENAGRITRYSDLRRYVSVNGARMHSLVGDPQQSTGLLDERGAYKKVSDVLEQYYDVTLTDCGTGLDNPGMDHVLELANRVVIVLEPALDAARAAVTTLEWLSRNGYERLGSTALAAISRVDPRVVSAAELEDLERFFQGRVAGVVRVPFDEHLARGQIVELGDLRDETRAACHRLARLSLSV